MASLYRANGTRVTRAAFPSAAVTGPSVVHALTEDIFQRRPASHDYKYDDAANGGQIYTLFRRAGSLMTVGEIDALYWVDAATIDSISPATGPAAGGTVVTIKGVNLDGVSGVTFGGTPGTSFSVVNRTTITVTTPAKAAGTYDVVIADDGGNVTKVGGFVYS